MAKKEYVHTVQMYCEVHRYSEKGNNLHRTDAITLHGLDEDDRREIARVFGSRIVHVRDLTYNSMALEGVESAEVLNVLSRHCGYQSKFDYKLNNPPMGPGLIDFRYNHIYTLTTNKEVKYGV